jgi:predicted lipoprotein with Yx(FWY)xxD motif
VGFSLQLFLPIATPKDITMFTDGNGMTLYVCDLDVAGTSDCYDNCAEKWTAYLFKENDVLMEGWTLAKRKEGTMQLLYLGNPTYLFTGDKSKGDMHGDGLDGVWHVLKG